MANRNGLAQSIKPPKSLTGEARKRWSAVVGVLSERGSFDAERFATYCQVWARWRKAEANIASHGQLVKGPGGRRIPNPLVSISTQASSLARSLERQLGLDQPTEPPALSPTSGESTTERLLTRRELSVACGVHMQTVTKWEAKDLPIAVRGSRGKPSLYRKSDVEAWRAAEEERRLESGVADAADAREQRDRAQAALITQTLQIRGRDLVPRAEAERVWAAEVSAVRALLLTWSSTLAEPVTRIAVLDGVSAVEEYLNKAVREVLNNLADPDRHVSESDTAA